MATFYAADIDWDTYDDDEGADDLPMEPIVLPEWMQEELNDRLADNDAGPIEAFPLEDEIADYLSDEYGFLVNSFMLYKVNSFMLYKDNA